MNTRVNGINVGRKRRTRDGAEACPSKYLFCMTVDNQLTGCEANPYTPTDIAPTSFLAAFGFKRDSVGPRIHPSIFFAKKHEFFSASTIH